MVDIKNHSRPVLVEFETGLVANDAGIGESGGGFEEGVEAEEEGGAGEERGGDEEESGCGVVRIVRVLEEEEGVGRGGRRDEGLWGGKGGEGGGERGVEREGGVGVGEG